MKLDDIIGCGCFALAAFGAVTLAWAAIQFTVWVWS